MNKREKPAGYCGIENVKFAVKDRESYATELLDVKFAKGLTLNSQVEATDQYADDRKIFSIPSDTGPTGELNTTAADPELEKAAGFALEGANGLLGVEMTSYLRGALYFEHIIYPETAKAQKVKTWLYNVQIGKGSTSYATKEKSLSLGTYAYPIEVHGDPTMNADGTSKYVDENGMEPLCFQLCAYPGDTDYDKFGESVPVPKVASLAAAGD